MRTRVIVRFHSSSPFPSKACRSRAYQVSAFPPRAWVSAWARSPPSSSLENHLVAHARSAYTGAEWRLTRAREGVKSDLHSGKLTCSCLPLSPRSGLGSGIAVTRPNGKFPVYSKPQNSPSCLPPEAGASRLGGGRPPPRPPAHLGVATRPHVSQPPHVAVRDHDFVIELYIVLTCPWCGRMLCSGCQTGMVPRDRVTEIPLWLSRHSVRRRRN